MNEEKTCFIAYPRWTSRATAHVIYLRLQNADFDVFYDPVRTIEPDDRKVVIGQISARTHVIALLPPGTAWLEDDSHSVFREELGLALDSGRHVVPMLLGNYDFDDLKPKLGHTRYRQLGSTRAIQLDYAYFDERIETLIARLHTPDRINISLTPPQPNELDTVDTLLDKINTRKQPTDDDISAEAAYFYAQKRLQYQDMTGAMTALTDALRFNPEFAAAYDARGALFKRGGDLDSAQADFDRAVSLNGQLHSAYMSRAQMHALQGDFQSAINDCTVAIKADSHNTIAYVQRGTVKLYQGDADGAIDDYTVALDLEPQNGELLRNRGMAYQNKGDHESALEDFTAAIALDARDDVGYTLRGQAKFEIDDIDGALEDFSQAIVLNPNNADAYAQRAFVRYKQYEDLQTVIGDYTNAISRRENPDLLHNRGLLHRMNDQYEDAIEDYSVAIKLAPEDAEVYFNRAVAYKLQGNYPAAIADYTRALALAPDDMDIYYNRGNAYAASGNTQAAIDDYSTVIANQTSHGKAYFNRGNAYRRLGKLDEAIQDYNRAQELMPANSMIYNNRGNVRRALGDLLGAKRDYARATRLSPDDWVAEHNARNFAPGEAEIEDDIDFAEGLDNFSPPPSGFGE